MVVKCYKVAENIINVYNFFSYSNDYSARVIISGISRFERAVCSEKRKTQRQCLPPVFGATVCHAFYSSSLHAIAHNDTEQIYIERLRKFTK